MYRQFTKELIQLKEFRLHELFKSEDDRWIATLKPVQVHNRCTVCDAKAHIHNRKSTNTSVIRTASIVAASSPEIII